MNVYGFTHSDLDGCCVILARLVYGDQLRSIKFCNYNNIDKELSSFLDKKSEEDAQQEFPDTPLLLITDICPSDETLKKIDQTANLMTVLLDHHKTKERSLSKYSWAKFDKNKCGAELMLNFLNKPNIHNFGPLFPEVEEWTRCVASWDLWKLDSKYRKRGEQLNALCFFLGMEEFVEVFSKNINADQLPEYQNLLKHLERNKKEYVNKIIKEQLHHTEYCMCGFTGKTFKILIASEFISDLGQAALADEDSEDLHYIAIVNPLNNTVSLRSRNDEDIDVEKIAKAFNGGGRFHASGFHLDWKKKLKNKIFKLLNETN